MSVESRIREAEISLGISSEPIKDEEKKVETSSNNLTSYEDVCVKRLFGIHIKGKNAALKSQNSYICIGKSELGDLSNISSKDELREIYNDVWPDSKGKGQDIGQIYRFVCESKIGDYVVFGESNKFSVGVISSDYYYDNEHTEDIDPDFVNFRSVNWILVEEDTSKLSIKFKNSLGSAMSFFCLDEHRDELFELLKDRFKITPPDYTEKDFLSEVFVNCEEYEEMVGLLERKKNLILQGSPGVGKTFIAKKLAYSIIGKKDDSKIEMVQFHQNYSYEDFIMGYKPSDNSGFKMEKGVFYNFCKKAEKDNDQNSKYFFIIDEINRGNLSKIFGELLLLIESDKRGPENKIQLAYKIEGVTKMFFVPENVYIIGMMNTADRSLTAFDYALRRRFCFYTINPAYNMENFKEYLEDELKISNSLSEKIIRGFTELNQKIANDEDLGPGFCIGHSYFCHKNKELNEMDWYESIIKFEIIPIIEEYCWDRTIEETEEYISIVR